MFDLIQNEHIPLWFKIIFTVILAQILGFESRRGFKRYEQEKREKEAWAKMEARGEAKVSVEDGYWACPNCNFKSQEIYDVCKYCGQLVSKD